jgi:hypothetical protein
VPQQSALTATAAAHDNQRLASMDVEGNIVKHRAIPETPDEMVDLDDGRVSRHDQNDEARMTKESQSSNDERSHRVLPLSP